MPLELERVGADFAFLRVLTMFQQDCLREREQGSPAWGSQPDYLPQLGPWGFCTVPRRALGTVRISQKTIVHGRVWFLDCGFCNRGVFVFNISGSKVLAVFHRLFLKKLQSFVGVLDIPEKSRVPCGCVYAIHSHRFSFRDSNLVWIATGSSCKEKKKMCVFHEFGQSYIFWRKFSVFWNNR